LSHNKNTSATSLKICKKSNKTFLPKRRVKCEAEIIFSSRTAYFLGWGGLGLPKGCDDTPTHPGITPAERLENAICHKSIFVEGLQHSSFSIFYSDKQRTNVYDKGDIPRESPRRSALSIFSFRREPCFSPSGVLDAGIKSKRSRPQPRMRPLLHDCTSRVVGFAGFCGFWSPSYF